MPYTIKTWDKETIILDDARGEIVREAWRKGMDIITINGNDYKNSAISQITKGGSLPIDKSKILEEGNRRSENYKDGEGYKKYQEMRAKFLKKR